MHSNTPISLAISGAQKAFSMRKKASENFSKILLGYSGDPSLIEVSAYSNYLNLSFYRLLRSAPEAKAEAA